MRLLKSRSSRNFPDVFDSFPAPRRRSTIAQANIATTGHLRRYGADATSEFTGLLERPEDRDPKAAEELLPLIYDELRKLAAKVLPVTCRVRPFRRRRWFMRHSCGWERMRVFCNACFSCMSIEDKG